MPFPDAAFLRPKPYLRPMVRTWDEQDRFVLDDVSHGFSCFLVSQIDHAEEVLRIAVANPRTGSRSVPKVTTRTEACSTWRNVRPEFLRTRRIWC